LPRRLEGNPVLDVVLLGLLAIAFAGAGGYILVCHNLTDVVNASADTVK
jgi:hypothetical protein